MNRLYFKLQKGLCALGNLSKGVQIELTICNISTFKFLKTVGRNEESQVVFSKNGF